MQMLFRLPDDECDLFEAVVSPLPGVTTVVMFPAPQAHAVVTYSPTDPFSIIPLWSETISMIEKYTDATFVGRD